MYPVYTPYKRPRIWVIDNSPTIRTLVTIVLCREGGEVIEYEEPLQALHDVKWELHPFPDVVLIDGCSSVIHASTLIRFLRSRQGVGRSAIIVISRPDRILPKLLAWLFGAVYLPKPFTTQQLLAQVIKYSPH